MSELLALALSTEALPLTLSITAVLLCALYVRVFVKPKPKPQRSARLCPKCMNYSIYGIPGDRCCTECGMHESPNR